MNKYITPKIEIDILENNNVLTCSNHQGIDDDIPPSHSECSHCACPCVSRDNPHQNYGCNGCLGCSGGPYKDNHACNN